MVKRNIILDLLMIVVWPMIVVAILIATAGCTSISYDRSSGKVKVSRFMTDAEVGRLTVVTQDGEMELEGYKSDAEAVAEAVAGAVAGALAK